MEVITLSSSALAVLFLPTLSPVLKQWIVLGRLGSRVCSKKETSEPLMCQNLLRVGGTGKLVSLTCIAEWYC